MIALHQKMVKSMGFKDLKESWTEDYEEDDFPALMMKTWTEEHSIAGQNISLEGLFKQVHAYVRLKLINKYNSQVMDIWAAM